MSGLGRFLSRLRGDRRGAAILEFALILPVFVVMVLGVINLGLLMGTMTSMNFAVQEAARCYAVNKTTCETPSAAVAFAEGKYAGPSEMPEFAATAGGCGHTVTATYPFVIDVAVATYSVPLSATACFPGVPEEEEEA